MWGGGVVKFTDKKCFKYLNGPYKSQNVNVQKYVMVFDKDGHYPLMN